MIPSGNLDFPLFIFSIVANLSLALIVLRYSPKSQSRMFFIIFVVAQTMWVIINYYAINSSPERILDMARWTIAAAVPHPLLFFLFIYTFSRQGEVIKKHFIIPSGFLILFFVLLARSPIVFTDLKLINGEPVPVPGFGMALFGSYTLIMVSLAFIHLYKSWKRSNGIERVQWRFVGIGLLITFLLILIFNFILAVVGEQTDFVKYGYLYTLPFVFFTAYAMIKHHLLNLKVIAAEMAVILLNLILFIQLVSSQTISQFILNGMIMTGTLVVGGLLIKGVWKEIHQRQELQLLTTKLKHMNNQLKILDKARADFITMASHQLRTPPATLKWYLSAVLAGEFGSLPQDLKLAMTKINITNDSLISLVDTMLNVSRIERGKLEFVLEPTDLAAITKLTVDQLTPLAQDKKLTLEYTPPNKKLPVLNADKEKLRQVVSNLIDNAIKYTKAGGIKVSLSGSEDNLLLLVCDTGKGMDKEESTHIFAKYGRGKNSEKYSAGLGLGLYLAKIVVESHKGIILVKSKGPNQGSCFSVSLPVKNRIKAKSFIYDMTKQNR